jgi:pimeloyl-ACP methyl ester carboxylesterase
MSDYLLVHGAFNSGWVWDLVAERLVKAGHRVRVADQLPSAGTDPGALGDLTADIEYVRRALEAIEGRVVLVGHSYSGMVITEFADDPQIRHSVYVAALWPDRGQSALNLMGETLPKIFVRRDDGALQITDDFTAAWQAFCPDLDQAAAHKALSRFALQSLGAFTVASTAPDRAHPSTYVIASGESDASVVAQEARASNADLTVRLSAAHMVQLSAPDQLAATLGRI